MRRGDYMYDVYIENLNNRKQDLAKVVRSTNNTLNYILDMLDNYEDEFAAYDLTKQQVLSKVYSGELTTKTITTVLHKTTNNSCLRYIRLYIVTYARHHHAKHKLKYLDLHEPPNSIFKNAIYTFNYNMVKEVLMGAKFRFGHKVGSIGIIEKERTYFLDGTEVTKNINWKESFAKRDAIIAEGKKPYHAKYEPDGIKWFVYHDEFYTYWYKWTSSIFNKLRLGSVFKPLAYVTVDRHERAKIEENVASVKEILDLEVFGPIEKLQLIKRKFPNHLLIFRNYA